MNRSAYLTAMRAESIPEGWSGLWYITKTQVSVPTRVMRRNTAVIVPPLYFTHLYRVTDSTLHESPPGEVVMEDTPFELRTHLGFVMGARGRVLVTGLGLGCVVRGLLANPAVSEVVCIENSPDILRLVGPHMPTARLTLIEADALKWTKKNKERFDCGWHDIWADRDHGQPHLDVLHARLMLQCRKVVGRQGAWSFDRQVKRAMVRRGFVWAG